MSFKLKGIGGFVSSGFESPISDLMVEEWLKENNEIEVENMKFKIGDKVRIKTRVEGYDNCEIEKYWFGEDTGYILKKEGRTINGIWLEDELELIEEVKGVNNMKKTFKEVVESIKAGEVWENAAKKITIDEDGYIGIESKNGTRYSKMSFSGTEEYELRRKEYSFTEALAAFELGKEIESCESDTVFIKHEDGYLIKSVDTNVKLEGDDSVFALYEIRGNWYINE